ncbi:hypothetical protein [Rhizobium halophilum]|uniref:hypothetical protein n=1 Tax=Rhizobium halophilum TaxID=2846852 RepID=UPI001EFDCC86|nr:hypothetical protein [Rhizobium halophilum]MCF6371148.1 hypothetical protein [Rhizobium halophilum]
MSEFISYLFAILVVGPLQAEVSERLQGVSSAEIVQAGRACISEEAPRLLQRAQADWAWAAANAIGVGVGLVDPLTLLEGESQQCNRAFHALSGASQDGEA